MGLGCCGILLWQRSVFLVESNGLSRGSLLCGSIREWDGVLNCKEFSRGFCLILLEFSGGSCKIGMSVF